MTSTMFRMDKFFIMIKSVFIVGMGGFVGAAIRFIISYYFKTNSTTDFPWSTLLVNIIGSLLIGILLGFFDKTNLLSSEWNIFLTVGFCGGFTTFSSLSNDIYTLVIKKEFIKFIAYTGFSFTFGLIAVFLGHAFAKAI